MPEHAFSVALNARFMAAQRALTMSRKQLIAAVAVKTDYDPESVKRHLDGKAIPQTPERALAYARAFGETEEGELMNAYATERRERDVAGVRAHLHRIGGMIVSVFVLACPALMGEPNCQMQRAPVSPRKVVTAMRKGDPRRRRTAPRARR